MGEQVEVEPWVLLMAFRYGLGRRTYAHGDALSLVRRYWPQMERWQGSIVSDLEHALQPVFEMPDDQRRATEDLLLWIAEQGVAA